MAYTTNEKVGKVRVLAIRMVLAGRSTREVARHFGYNQSTIVRWYKRRNEVWHKRGELPTRSSRPHISPNRTSKEIEVKILTTRKETKRCAEVVHEQLKLEKINVSLSTVKRVLSRYGYAMLSKKANISSSLRFLKKVREYFDFKISCVQTDNGSEFGKWFTDHCGTKHRHNHPRSPNENGHLERFNRTIQEEPEKHGLSIFNTKDVEKYLEHYNTKRMHMGIKFKTPQQMLR